MAASTLRKLAALLFALVPLIPLAGLYAEQHDCACGMSQDACFCDHAAERPGAHCDLRGAGQCSMRPVQTPSGAALFVSFDLCGWLQMRSWQEAGPDQAPADAVPLADERVPRSFSRSPEPPPPRFLLSA